jgi:metal-responsive CopG/Arc/MetJ family transcriptional regulator
MKEKTSVTLSKDVLTAIDRLAGTKKSRSAFIDNVLREHLQELARARRDAREIAIINRNADRLNREAEDALEYQAPLGEYPED